MGGGRDMESRSQVFEIVIPFDDFKQCLSLKALVAPHRSLDALALVISCRFQAESLVSRFAAVSILIAFLRLFTLVDSRSRD